eukprot:PhM_4_TR5772/c0_g1_i1/m.30694
MRSESVFCIDHSDAIEKRGRLSSSESSAVTRRVAGTLPARPVEVVVTFGPSPLWLPLWSLCVEERCWCHWKLWPMGTKGWSGLTLARFASSLLAIWLCCCCCCCVWGFWRVGVSAAPLGGAAFSGLLDSAGTTFVSTGNRPARLCTSNLSRENSIDAETLTTVVTRVASSVTRHCSPNQAPGEIRMMGSMFSCTASRIPATSQYMDEAGASFCTTMSLGPKMCTWTTDASASMHEAPAIRSAFGFDSKLSLISSITARYSAGETMFRSCRTDVREQCEDSCWLSMRALWTTSGILLDVIVCCIVGSHRRTESSGSVSWNCRNLNSMPTMTLQWKNVTEREYIDTTTFVNVELGLVELPSMVRMETDSRSPSW